MSTVGSFQIIGVLPPPRSQLSTRRLFDKLEISVGGEEVTEVISSSIDNGLNESIDEAVRGGLMSSENCECADDIDLFIPAAILDSSMDLRLSLGINCSLRKLLRMSEMLLAAFQDLPVSDKY